MIVKPTHKHLLACLVNILDENRVAVASNNKVEPSGLCNMSVKPTHMLPTRMVVEPIR